MCLQPSFGPMPPLPYSMLAPPQVLQGLKKALQLPNMNERSLAKVPQLAGFAVPQPMNARLTKLPRVVGPQVLQPVAAGAQDAAAGVAQPLAGATITIGCGAATGAGTSPAGGLASAAGAGGVAGIGAWAEANVATPNEANTARQNRRIAHSSTGHGTKLFGFIGRVDHPVA
jgi:hypothetical protein